jgi:hypothetical protein
VLARVPDEWTPGADLHALVLCCKGGGPPKKVEYRELYSHLERLPIPAVAAMMEDL